MNELGVLLVLLAIGLFISGPVAVILSIILFNKIGSINRRLNKLEGKTEYGSYGVTPARPIPPASKPVTPMAAAAPKPQPQAPIEEIKASTPVEPSKPAQPISQPKPTIASKPMETAPSPPKPSYTPPKSQTPPASKPVSEVVAAMKEFVPIKPKPAVKGGLELKLGTTVALIVGVITVIIGVGFFLKLVYEKMTFGPVARVSMVAAGGLIALVVGEVLRRKNFEIVAKGIAALGFALLYAAVFSGSRVYALFSIEWAFALSILVTAAAMAYAVVLDEILIAFLALLGGYLSPFIITSGQNLPMPLFSYVFVLSAGAIGCAMFRRWRAVNWIAMVGTYLLYTAWFEKFYSADQVQTALFWLGVFAGMYLVLPILNGLIKKLVARSEDVTLVVVNSIAVYYYLWRMLYNGSRQDLAVASAFLGAAHIAMVFVVLWRCREDEKLQASLGVLGTAFVTAAFPMYFNTMQPTLVGWSIEAVVLTFIGIRYNSLWTKVMSVLVAAVASAGLLYHLPLHVSEEFKLIFNSPFATWIFVGLAIMLCHALWRFIPSEVAEERTLMSQAYFVWGGLLLAAGAALEWHDYCDWHIVILQKDQAWFLMGMVVIAAILFIGYVTRPVSPKGDLVRMVGVMVMVAGSAFTALAMMGIYYEPFTIFFNGPFLIAALFVTSLYYGVWQIKRTATETDLKFQLPGALATMGMVLVLALLSEQIYMYWYCRDYYGQSVANWQSIAFHYIFILWAVAGVVMLLTGIQFKKPVLKGLAITTSMLSAVGLFWFLPLHDKGDFRFVFNQPFLSWVCVSVSLLIGHGLWRFMIQANDENADPFSQIYYAAGLVLLAVGVVMEWFAHCEYQIVDDAVGSSRFLQGSFILLGLVVLSFLARPLPPQGLFPMVLGMLTALGGAAWTVLAMTEVYHDGFIIFANPPFLSAAFFVGVVLLSAWFVKRNHEGADGRFRLSAALVLGTLVLVWVLLSEQIYQYFWYHNKYVQALENWRFLSQMYISVAWAIYAAVLIVIGFVFRAAAIRYLSLLIFAVLLGKINLDVWNMGSGYMVARIATFLTTGLILVGVSLLYQYLKNRGFFETIGKQIAHTE